MLVGLHVKNLALIEQADVEFGNGLNILTGETGAGKSIIIGSVALALGAKASRDMIRCGEEYAYIELIFSVDDEKKREELKKMDVYPDEDGLLIISKKITQTRSISRINDETVTTARLKAVTGKLLDIHGQHEHQSLLHKQKHLEILDEYSWRETGSLKKNVAESYRRYLELKGKLDGFSLDEESRKRELDFVRFEIDEIEDSALKPGEEEELAAKFRKFSHSQKIMERLQGAYQAVDGDAGVRTVRWKVWHPTMKDCPGSLRGFLTRKVFYRISAGRSQTIWMRWSFQGKILKRRKNVWILSVELWQNTEIARKLS